MPGEVSRSFDPEGDYPEDDYDRDPDASCHYCRGEGWGLAGVDWGNDDPVNTPDGEVEVCPCCGGSGDADDCTFW